MARRLKLVSGEYVLVSDKDYTRVSAHRWYLLRKRPRKGGPYARKINPHQYLHQFILGAVGVDHKNGNGLDCRRSNLRLATQSQNSANVGLRRNNSSGVKGAYWDKQNGKWLVQIRCNGKRYTIGRFSTKEQAASAYERKAKELFGEFAKADMARGLEK